MRKYLFALTVSIAAITMVGCGETTNEDPNEREVKASEETEVEAAPTEEPAEEEVVEPKKDPVGTRSNPLPFGDIVTVETAIYDSEYNEHAATLDLSLLEVLRGEEAWPLIEAENMFNEKAPEGFEDVLIKVKATVTDAETENDPLTISSYEFKFVSSDGTVYDDMTMVVAPDQLDGELYNGATLEGYVHANVKTGDDFKLSYEPMSGSPVFFNIK